MVKIRLGDQIGSEEDIRVPRCPPRAQVAQEMKTLGPHEALKATFQCLGRSVQGVGSLRRRRGRVWGSEVGSEELLRASFVDGTTWHVGFKTDHDGPPPRIVCL